MSIKKVTAADMKESYGLMDLVNSDMTARYVSEGQQEPKKLLWVQLELSSVRLISKILMNPFDWSGHLIVRIGNHEVNNASSKKDQQKAISRNAICNRYSRAWQKGIIKIGCHKPIVGQFVILQISGNFRYNGGTFMSLSEFAVYRNLANEGKYLNKELES